MFFINPPFSNYIKLPDLIQIKGSYTLEPRDGLISQIFKNLRYNFYYKDWTNKIGLRNPGIDYAIKNYEKGSIVSVAIMNQNEIPILLNKIPDNMDIEINVSCPNVNNEKKHFNYNLLKDFLNEKRKWCIIKLSPTIKNKLIDNYYNIGFRQFHCSNTVPVPEGGLSGKAIIPYNKKIIPYIKNKYNDVIVIGGGGIKRKEDILEYKKMGADHFSFSSVTFCPYLFIKLYLSK